MHAGGPFMENSQPLQTNNPYALQVIGVKN